MLANKTKLEYKSSGSAFTELEGLKSIPDFAAEPEMVENTPLNADSKRYEIGVKDFGSLEYGFVWDNSKSSSAYRVMRGFAATNTKVSFKQTYPDGTTFSFDAIPSVGSNGGELNAVIDWKLTLALQTDVTITDPSAG